MDYYQQHRTQQVPTPQTGQQHYVYSSPTNVANSQLYYQQQMQTQQAAYQQHFPMSAGPASASMEYVGYQSSQPSQPAIPSPHSTIGNGRGRGGSRSGDPPAHQTTPAVRFTHLPSNPAVQEFPLRIVIDAKHIGAIIGSKGNNIREITADSKARVVVDAHRVYKDRAGHTEKIITIIGNQECASKACARILEVVQRELDREEGRDPNADVEMKIRAHNQLVGRLIGRQGATIKKIMQETGTTISVSSSNEAASHAADLAAMMVTPLPDMMFPMERTITIKGPTLEHVATAEQRVSAKLRQSFETDLINRIPVPSVPGGLPGVMVPDPYALLMRPMQQTHPAGQTSKVVKMYVPNNMVGAIIGSKGSNIRNIMRNSGANIRIDGGDKKEKTDEETPRAATPVDLENPAAGDAPKLEEKKEDERLVTISGNDYQQYGAQFLIFHRIAAQSQQFVEELKLRTEVVVPSRLVGRIIGKGGQNVRELQRITGASVKIPEDEPKVEPHEEAKDSPSSSEGTVVRIVGNFTATQSVQARIGQLINEFNRTSLQEKRREEQTGQSAPASEEDTAPITSSSPPLLDGATNGSQ